MAKNVELLKEAREKAKLFEEAAKDNRDAALEDIKFVFSEDQWEESVKNVRGDLPCLNSNDLPIFLDQIVGDHRMNRGGIKVHPVDSQTDPKKAEVIGGLIRNIEHLSDAHVAYDQALEFVAAGGYAGAIRVITQYEEENLFDDSGLIKPEFQGELAKDAFNQEIRIVPCDNPLNVLYDPNAKLWHKNDGKDLFYYDDILIDTFKERYPRAQAFDFEGEVPSHLEGWFNMTNRTVRVAEWFRKESKGSKKVYLVLNEDESYSLETEKPEDESRIQQTRQVEDFDIVWRLISGNEVLEGPIKIPGKLFPIIPVWGKEININGEKKLRGMFRYAKDPQRSYIYTQSKIVETVALAPKAPWQGTIKMFEGLDKYWKRANIDNLPYLPSNPDPEMPGIMPKRTDPVQPPVGLIEMGATRSQEKRNVIGLQEASLGRRSNETSGRAIMARQQAGNFVTFAYIDNLNRAIRQTGRVIIGMIPTIYATERVLRIVGVDGRESMQPVNQRYENEQGQEEIVDLTVGKHDVVVMTGPSYGTQRIEFVDRLTQIMQYAPAIASLLAPSTIEMMDIPHSEKIVKILESMLPPQAQQALGVKPTISPEQVQQAIAQAIQQYQGSVDAQQEQEKTKQQELKTTSAQYKLKEAILDYLKATQEVNSGGDE